MVEREKVIMNRVGPPRRTRLLVVLAGVLVLSTGGAVAAQERVVTDPRGEVPTTGGPRPGPIGSNPSTARPRGVLPVAIKIDKAQVDAQIEQQEIVGGAMQNPSGPWVVSWYKETGKLGEVGNAVMAGHLDYWDVGPAVFSNLGRLSEGDEIAVTGDDGATYTYRVVWSRLFETATAPIAEIVGPTADESLTLITCGGPFDDERGEYIQRLVVRAVRVP